MSRTGEDEYELVVGNRHVLSVVFVLIVLFGVFFSLGYFVGRNSSGDAPAQPQTPQTAPAAHGVSQPKEAPPQSETALSEIPIAPGEAQVSTGTAPAAGPQQEAAASTKPAGTTAQPAPEPARAAPAAPGLAAPAPGETYLQVVAVKRAEAEVVADLLRQKGFHAIVAPVVVDGVAADDLFRALVGPLKDAAEVARTKSQLEAAGFKPIVRKY